MDSSLTFSDQEIQEELSRLGYDNIPYDKLKQFQKDLNQLVLAERSGGNSHNNSLGSGDDGITTQEHREEFLASPVDTLLDKNNAADGPGAGQYCLRREDLEEHDLRHKEKSKEKPSVPGHFSLFELPPKVQHFRDDVSETESEIRRMKRKTLRKNEEGAKFIDESMSDIDTGSIIDTHERMQRMVLRDLDLVEPRRSQSARSREPPPYRLGPDDPRPPSVIYPSFDHPHTRNLRRADPVARYHQMQQAWATQQAPGENQRKDLRWNVREQMLTQFVPEKKPQRKYIPNNYIPPTEKQRKALRWQIRMDMA
ncbi:centriolar and ciliogenesis-associated protein HYLS1-like [Babylonia areolata]|uniref:centriolar and ciliogenesis-associated protein HYLS1-like n=1 Tax=Babylonia areolata TaxID=304850 RepID=UPI003FD2D532